jgi:hypothetical protein
MEKELLRIHGGLGLGVRGFEIIFVIVMMLEDRRRWNWT